MALSSSINIELCGVAVYQSKVWFNEGPKKLTHKHRSLHTRTYTHTDMQIYTIPEGCFSLLLIFDSYSFIFNHSSVFWVERYFMFGERHVIITN